MQPVESRCDKEDRPVNVITSRKFNSVLVLVRLAEKEGDPQYHGKEQVSEKPVGVIFNDVSVGDGNGYSRSKE